MDRSVDSPEPDSATRAQPEAQRRPIVGERRKLQNWTFLVLFALSVYLFWLVAQPLWVPIFLGMLIAMALHPVHKRVLLRSPRRGALSAAVLTGPWSR